MRIVGLFKQTASTFNQYAKDRPILVGFSACFLKGSFCDGVAQCAVEKQDHFDIRRNVGFACYSGFYMGVFQSYVFNGVYSWIFGRATTWQVAMKKSLFDATVHTPFLYLPAGYFASNALNGKDVLAGLRKYMDPSEMLHVNATCAAVWLPTHYITFCYCPQHLRIVFAASVSALWLIVMSSFAYVHKKEPIKQPISTDLVMNGMLAGSE
eukprot:TRINITY_DN110915_c0_g1_i1.p1 TRINITY_DN110915_c0_g1~~TRINITY_DN110915_c0_g1_i1.p1  ORF type:complete len:226 (+),score=36.81 TRINITY_DN110915_c0_g1_i1:49-678(+)